MTLTIEDLLIIEDTVKESYELHRKRAGDELAREITDELYEELIERHQVRANAARNGRDAG